MRGLDSRAKPDYDKERFGIEIIDSRTLGGAEGGEVILFSHY